MSKKSITEEHYFKTFHRFLNEQDVDGEAVMLSQLTWDIVKSNLKDIGAEKGSSIYKFPPTKTTYNFPNPSDETSVVSNENQFNSWKEELLKKVGDVEVLFVPGDRGVEVQINDPKFQSAKSSFMKAKGAEMDRYRNRRWQGD